MSFAYAGAQELQPSAAVSDVVEVRVVNLEVVVTQGKEGKGDRIRGLLAEDFRLSVDGVETPIEYFTEVSDGSALPPAPSAEKGPTRNIGALSAGDRVGTSYLLFIDELFSLARDRDPVLQDLRSQLSLLGPQDRMAIVAFDGLKLDLLSSWSQSAEALDEALRMAQKRKSFGMLRHFERRNHDRRVRLEQDLLPGDEDSRLAELGGEEHEYAQLVVDQIAQLVLATTSTLRSFAAPPGRKVMLILSGGWPFRPVEYVVNHRQRAVVNSYYPRGGTLYEPIVQTANLLGYTLYPVDLPGLQAQTKVEETTAPASTTGLSALRENNVHDALRYLAVETGGKSFLNARRTRSFDQVVADTRSYYWLGFTPTWRGDDQEHRVKVEVRRRGLRVRARSGYQDLSREREVSMSVESGLLFGNPPSPQPLIVELGPPRKAGAGKVDVPITIGIPLDAVVLVPTGDRLVARLDLRMAALDKDGGRSEIPVVPMAVSIRSDERETVQLATYDTTLRLRKKKSKMVVAVHDPLSGTILSTTVELAP